AGAIRGIARQVLRGPGRQTGGVDTQQQAHRYPAPRRRTGRVRPDAFAAVMATGIVSIAAADHEFEIVSAVLAATAAIGLPVLMVLGARTWRRESWSLRDIDTAIGLLTYVAACCVLAARFDEHPWVVLVLGGMALQAWVSLLPFVIRGLWRLRWVGMRDR